MNISPLGGRGNMQKHLHEMFYFTATERNISDRKCMGNVAEQNMNVAQSNADSSY